MCQQNWGNSTTFQFLTKDPARADGEESAYQYAGGDPVGKVDPSGLWTTEAAFAINTQAKADHLNNATTRGRLTYAALWGVVTWLVGGGLTVAVTVPGLAVQIELKSAISIASTVWQASRLGGESAGAFRVGDRLVVQRSDFAYPTTNANDQAKGLFHEIYRRQYVVRHGHKYETESLPSFRVRGYRAQKGQHFRVTNGDLGWMWSHDRIW